MHVYYNNGTEEWVLSDGHGKDAERMDVGIVREYQEQVSAEFLAAYALLMDEYVHCLEYTYLDIMNRFRNMNVFEITGGDTHESDVG